MSRRGARLAVAVLFALACGAAGWQYLRVERALASQGAATAAFERDARSLTTSIADLRAAQQAYVAAGQGVDYWTARVTRQLGSLRSRIDALRAEATSPSTVTKTDAAVTALEDFTRMDGRAREYVVANQRLLASDLIFGDGFEMTEAIAAEIDGARAAEHDARTQAAGRLLKQQRWLGAGVGGLGLLFLLILAIAPGPRSRPQAAEPLPAPSSLNLIPPMAPVKPAARGPDKPAADIDRAGASPIDLTRAAELCVDLARVSDTEQIPALLERASRLLDASGIVLWIADPEGRELVPTVAHGYPAATMVRLGAIPRTADNATAAAFREGQVRTVSSDTLTSGAIVAPLVVPGGCVGVMAAEVRDGREQRDEVRAVAAILAAQLATLIGVAPVAQPHAKAN